MTTWYASRDVGKFRAGFTYTDSQLGVLGRMAVKCGHLLPIVEPEVKAVKPVKGRKKAASGTEGWADGEAGV